MKTVPLWVRMALAIGMAWPLLSMSRVVYAAPSYDAMSAATGPTPPPPTLKVSGSPVVVNNAQYVSGGGLSTINLELFDAAAKGYPGSLILGVLSNGICASSGPGLPQGAKLTVQTVSDTQLTGVFTWQVPAGTSPTSVTFCGLNSFWEEQVTRSITITSDSLVKTVVVTSAIFNGKTRKMTVKGNAVPQARSVKLKGSSLIIANALNGVAIESGVLKGNAFIMTFANSSSQPPATDIYAEIGGTQSTPFKVKLVNAAPGPTPVPSGDTISFKTPVDGENGAIMGQPYTYQVQATDSLGYALTYSLVPGTGPSGLAVSPTGLVTWTPTPQNSSVDSHYTYTVKAVSTSGQSATQLMGVGVCPPGTAWMDGMGGMCM